MSERSVLASEVAAAVGGRLHGEDRRVAGVCTLGRAERDKLCFAQDLDRLQGGDPGGAILIAPPEAEGSIEGTWIAAENPRLAYAKAVAELLVEAGEAGVAASASVHPTARIADGVSIGEGCVIGPFAEIGEESRLAHHVVIGRAVRIGRRCTIGSHSVIGEEGFGLARGECGHYSRIPHLGSVAIGDDVQIGALSSIAAGTIEPTVIETGVRIDDQVFIAHNCRIGENVMIVACAEISGSVTIGRNSWIGPNATIRDQVAIPADSLIGMAATVTKTLTEPGIYAGSPARLMGPVKGS
jgi:UDP-3-O-[3-hydroxymyristoyl] glucosamine N-acyltransferase LpxD